MPYISGFDRDQLMCCSWDEFVDKESIARIIDAFVNSLDISRYGVKPVSVEGRRHMIRKVCINCIFMEAEKEFVLHANWQKAAK